MVNALSFEFHCRLNNVVVDLSICVDHIKDIFGFSVTISIHKRVIKVNNDPAIGSLHILVASIQVVVPFALQSGVFIVIQNTPRSAGKLNIPIDRIRCLRYAISSRADVRCLRFHFRRNAARRCRLCFLLSLLSAPITDADFLYAFVAYFSFGFGSAPTHQPRSLLTVRSTASRLLYQGSS